MDIKALDAGMARSAPAQRTQSTDARAEFRSLLAGTAQAPAAPTPASREFIPNYDSAAAMPPVVPSEAEAKITAAQIAVQANVFAPLKRDPVIPAVAPAETPAPPPITGRYLPLNRAPAAPLGQTIPSRAVSPATIESLRAKNKFAPGAVNQSNAAALAAAQRRALNPSAPAKEIAAPTPPQSLQWADEAVRNLDKYDAMKGRAKTP